MKKRNEPYYSCEMDIVHHIASFFHVIPNGNIPDMPDILIYRTAETDEDFEFVYNRLDKVLKYKDINLYLKSQIREFDQRANEIEMFDPRTFSEDIQLIHDYLKFLKGKENNQTEEKTNETKEEEGQGTNSVDKILIQLFPDLNNDPASLKKMSENLNDQKKSFAAFSSNNIFTFVGMKKDLWPLLGKLIRDGGIKRATIIRVFSEDVKYKRNNAVKAEQLTENEINKKIIVRKG